MPGAPSAAAQDPERGSKSCRRRGHGAGPPSCGLRKHRSCCPIAVPMGLGSLAAFTTQVTPGGHGHRPPLLSPSDAGGWRNGPGNGNWMVTVSPQRSSCMGYPGGQSSISHGSHTWPMGPLRAPGCAQHRGGDAALNTLPSHGHAPSWRGSWLGEPGIEDAGWSGDIHGQSGQGEGIAQGLSLQEKWMMEVQ